MRCDHCGSGEKCRAEGTHYLLADDEYAPGGPLCAAHAAAIVAEINDKRIDGEETWSTEAAVIVNGFPLRARDHQHRAAPCGCRFLFSPAGEWALQARCADKSHSVYAEQKRIVVAAFHFDIAEEEVA